MKISAFLAIAILAGVFVALGLFWRNGAPVNPSDYAAWAEAITAAVAIIGAFAVVLWQHELQAARSEIERLRARATRFEAAYQLAFYCAEVSDRITKEIIRVDQAPDVGELRNAHAELATMGNAFQQFRIGDFEGYEELSSLIRMMSIHQAITDAVRDGVLRGETNLVGNVLLAEIGRLRPTLSAQLEKLSEVAEAARIMAGER